MPLHWAIPASINLKHARPVGTSYILHTTPRIGRFRLIIYAKHAPHLATLLHNIILKSTLGLATNSSYLTHAPSIGDSDASDTFNAFPVPHHMYIYTHPSIWGGGVQQIILKASFIWQFQRIIYVKQGSPLRASGSSYVIIYPPPHLAVPVIICFINTPGQSGSSYILNTPHHWAIPA